MLQLHDIDAGYGTTRVLRGVSLTVGTGRVVALLGPNGAGKTTLLRVAGGLLRPTAGSMLAEGREVTTSSPSRRARMGLCLIPDRGGVFRSLTVKENLQILAGSRPVGDSVALAVDAFPRLGERLGQVAGTLSGGEQQMLALARAHISKASVVMLDEVSMGLAPRVVDEIFEYLHSLAQRGVSLLIVEQYVQRALAMADDVYLLNRGVVTFTGTPDQLDADELMRRYVGVDVLPV